MIIFIGTADELKEAVKCGLNLSPQPNELKLSSIPETVSETVSKPKPKQEVEVEVDLDALASSFLTITPTNDDKKLVASIEKTVKVTKSPF